MLLFTIVPLLGAAIAAADLYCLRRRKRAGEDIRMRAAWYAATDALPLAVGAGELCMKDNSTEWMLAVMWMVWLWMLTAGIRTGYRLFAAAGWPRTGAAAGVLAALLLAWGATGGRTRLRVERTTVCSPKIPAAFDGMRIALISDLHVGTMVHPEREIGRLAERINGLRPDIVCFTGDLVNIRASELDAKAVGALSRIEAPVYAVTGNHDLGCYIKDYERCDPNESLARTVEAQREMGWTVLCDSTCYLVRGRDSLALTGIAMDPAFVDPGQGYMRMESGKMERLFAGVPDTAYGIVLVHCPQLWDQLLEEGRGELTLAGHIHAMQMKIRVGRLQWSPVAWLRDRWSGRYDVGGRTLYINDGAGCVGFPMRLGAAPEITIITLETCE